MKNTNKLIIASLTMALCLCCMGGLYIISNADFTNPDISLTMDIQDISKPQWILFNDSYSGGTEVRIDDGTTYFTQDKRQDGNISHQFTTPGRHKVRIYANGNRSLLVMTNNQSIVKFI